MCLLPGAYLRLLPDEKNSSGFFQLPPPDPFCSIECCILFCKAICTIRFISTEDPVRMIRASLLSLVPNPNRSWLFLPRVVILMMNKEFSCFSSQDLGKSGGSPFRVMSPPQQFSAPPPLFCFRKRDHNLVLCSLSAAAFLWKHSHLALAHRAFCCFFLPQPGPPTR